MTTSHQFGGQWTEDKLNRLQKYLNAYLTIFKGNPRARYYKTIYVDAFAGTGKRDFPNVTSSTLTPLFPDEADVKDFQEGSAWIALQIEPSFDHYLFIEQNPTYANQLKQLSEQFPYKRVNILTGEANQKIQEWCQDTNWENHRAVVFLDPYGMQVEWTTIETLASTKAVDLWILFPLGQGVNRMLTKNSPPPKAWADRLTKLFGTSDWQDAFYQPSTQMNMFETEERIEKVATFNSIKNFFVERLEAIFDHVAKNSRPLYNSRNVPIYLLCFAATNPTAVKIAQDILKKD